MQTLIIKAELSNPPSEILAFRTLTMFACLRLYLDNLIELEQDCKDIYYHYLKARGAMDFIAQLITPRENERGIRIDLDYNYPLTIKTDRIIFKNIFGLLGQINYLRKL